MLKDYYRKGYGRVKWRSILTRHNQPKLLYPNPRGRTQLRAGGILDDYISMYNIQNNWQSHLFVDQSFPKRTLIVLDLFS